MATFKEISPSDIKTTKSFLNQIVDVIQEDVSGSVTRKHYQQFITGGVGPGVTSSIFQTVFDQDYTLQTANAIFDMTVGLFSGSNTVLSASSGQDSNGMLLFPQNTLMMREKVDIYKQHAQALLGNSTLYFTSPFNGATESSQTINEALFINFKRLFSRDKIKKESFAIKMYASATIDNTETLPAGGLGAPLPNLILTSPTGSKIYADIGSATTSQTSYGGEVGNIVNTSNTSQYAGLIFYDQGIVVLNIPQIISGSQHVSGTIDAVNSAGSSLIGDQAAAPATGNNPRAKFIPDLMVSASIDDIVDHFAACRFSSGTLSGMTFKNVTTINSTRITCRATADEFNYSSNPTYLDDDNRINVIDQGQENYQKSFTFITSVGLYDANNNLLGVAKLSRACQKSDEKDISIQVRFDYASKARFKVFKKLQK